EILFLHEDEAGKLWVACGEELNILNQQGEIYAQYTHNIANPPHFQPAFIQALQSTPQEKVYLEPSYGWFVWNEKMQGFAFVGKKKRAQPIAALSKHRLLLDQSGSIWLPSSEGVRIIPPYGRQFRGGKAPDLPPHIYQEPFVRAVQQDEKYFWWANAKGLFRVARKNPTNEPEKVLEAAVLSIFKDRQGSLWVGTTQKGLYQIAPVSGNILAQYQLESDNPSGPLKKGTIFDIVEDQEGNLWVASWGCLHRFNPKNKNWEYFTEQVGQNGFLQNDLITSLVSHPNGGIWVGTGGGGLHRVFKKEEEYKFENYRSHPDKPHTLSSNLIISLHQDQSGIIWVGTDAGLNRFDPETGKIRRFLKKDGLGDDKIMGISEDQTGHLWVSTLSHGLCRINLANYALKSFKQAEGLPTESFLMGSVYRSPEGRLFFGGEQGLCIFHPDSLWLNQQPPAIFLTGLSFGNYTVQSGDSTGLLKKDISRLDSLILSYDQNTFSLRFAALNFIAPQQNQYAYRLKGFLEDWQDLKNYPEINFTNLPPGEYCLYIKASNNEGVWNEKGIQIYICISPPWWASPGAYVFYVIGSLGLLFLIYRVQLTRKLQNLEIQQLKKIDQFKNRLQANISHEFRTPLTIIQEANAQIQSQANQEALKDILPFSQSIAYNQAYLKQLVDQMLDIAQLEAGKVPNNWVKTDMMAYLQKLQEGFSIWAKQEQLHL
ncbi:MAG: two-component regulator propeller domain-containing protein, partial [Bacteroidota bacterium]